MTYKMLGFALPIVVCTFEEKFLTGSKSGKHLQRAAAD